MMKLSVKEMTCVAISVALITICSWISVPLTIPVTLQTFAICLVTALLGLKLIPGNSRAAGGIDDCGIDAEIVKCLLKSVSRGKPVYIIIDLVHEHAEISADSFLTAVA